MSHLLVLAAVVVDCADADATAAFYATACGGTIASRHPDSTYLALGGTTIIFRSVPGYTPPSWPTQETPMQVHLDFVVTDLDAAELRLQDLGATMCEFQAHRADGLLVMRDPAGHLFCIGTPV